MKELLSRIYPLHRTLASDDTYEALKIIGEYLPKEYEIQRYNPGEAAWDWTIPPAYNVRSAYVRAAYVELNGNRVVDFADNYLHLVSYSHPIYAEMRGDELATHLHFSSSKPNAIPWKYSYYNYDWGFCLSLAQYKTILPDAIYKVVIDAGFDNVPGAFKTASYRIGESKDELVVLAHIDHPNQANDDAAGVVVAVEVAKRLTEHPLPEGSISVRFLFMPETIGTIAYLSRHEDLIPNMKGGMFIEMPGAGQSIAVQHTLGGEDILDQMAYKWPSVRRHAEFATLAANDERVMSAPNVGVPCVSLTRAPYPEYHTSDDNLSIIDWGYMAEMVNTVEYAVRMFASNYVPVPLFRGPAMLSKHGLFVDWQTDWKRNRTIEAVMMRMDGKLSVFDIAEEVGEPYWDVRKVCDLFVEKGLAKNSNK